MRLYSEIQKNAIDFGKSGRIFALKKHEIHVKIQLLRNNHAIKKGG